MQDFFKRFYRSCSFQMPFLSPIALVLQKSLIWFRLKKKMGIKRSFIFHLIAWIIHESRLLQMRGTGREVVVLHQARVNCE